MKKATLQVLIIGIIIVMFSSCSTLHQSIKGANTRVELVKSDFDISAQVSGQAEQVKILGVDWKRLFNEEEGNIMVPIISTNMKVGKVESYAIYNLLEQNKGYDVLFYPTFNKEVKNILGVYIKTTVNTNARLGKLN